MGAQAGSVQHSNHRHAVAYLARLHHAKHFVEWQHSPFESISSRWAACSGVSPG
jgi:hypothetical protein